MPIGGREMSQSQSQSQSQSHLNLPAVRKYQQEIASKQKFLDPAFVESFRKHVQESSEDGEKLRRDRLEYANIISKAREAFVRDLRAKQSQALHIYKPCSVYAPYYYQFFTEDQKVFDEDDEDEKKSDDDEEEEEFKEPPVPDVPPGVVKTINACLAKRKDHLIAQVDDIQVTVRDLEKLCGLNWLTDPAIAFYLWMITDRSARNRDYLKVHCFSSYFYTKLTRKDYGGPKAVMRWTRKMDVLSYDLLLFPIHLPGHWTLAAISTRDQTINYYDSLGGENEEVLRVIMDYWENEYKTRKGEVLDTSKWKSQVVKNIPRQANTCDCGVYLCKFSERLAANKPFNFSQRHIPFIRQCMIYEICKKKLFSDLDELYPLDIH
ncbi:sentrin-specific protease 1-like [Brevipalpus obovatus]|uniref:sentrin-specific protease 1-like n=1 Tax=Brevipalpus obovatus TaxID=246614 RepID=UPI003D9E92E1